MPQSTGDTVTAAPKQIVSAVQGDEEPGDSIAPMGAYKLRGVEPRRESSQIKNMQPLLYVRSDLCPYGHALLQNCLLDLC